MSGALDEEDFVVVKDNGAYDEVGKSRVGREMFC